MPSTKSTAWVFTLNNYTSAECNALLSKDVRGLAVGKEVGESGTPHLQGAICCHEQSTLAHMKRIVGQRAHIEPMYGTWEEARAYALKDGDILVDRGEGPKPGDRADLRAFIEASKDMSNSESDMWEMFPSQMTRYFRAFERVRDVEHRKLARASAPKVYWIHGETGVGKSHLVFQDLDLADVYVHEVADGGWFDDYRGQSVMILNEFRGEISYSEMLSLCDKWPKKVKRRCREPIPFVAKTIYITCSLPPEKVYCRQNEKDDSISQLLRRIKVIHKTKGDLLTRDNLDLV